MTRKIIADEMILGDAARISRHAHDLSMGHLAYLDMVIAILNRTAPAPAAVPVPAGSPEVPPGPVAGPGPVPVESSPKVEKKELETVGSLPDIGTKVSADLQVLTREAPAFKQPAPGAEMPDQVLGPLHTRPVILEPAEVDHIKKEPCSRCGTLTAVVYLDLTQVQYGVRLCNRCVGLQRAGNVKGTG